MDDKDPPGPGDPGPGRARGHGDGPPPRLRSRGRSEVLPSSRGQSPGLSTFLPIPTRSNSSGVKTTSQPVFRDEGPLLRSRGPNEALQPTTPPSSIPEGAYYSGEKTKQSVSKDGAPPSLSRGRSEGLPPPPPSPGQTAGLSVSLPIEESADTGGEKAKLDGFRDEKVLNGLFICNA